MTRAVLLDENMPREVAIGLSAAGHDVLAVASASRGVDDHGILAFARQSARVD